jgi:UDP-glucose 4-epimerase
LRGGHLLLTGSLFEAREGEGSNLDLPFSPYGLSKGLTADLFAYYCARAGICLGKFVIPNPFGPLEEARFTDYLVRSWAEGRTPTVATPDYVRDNIHVSLLALAYANFADRLVGGESSIRTNPSGYAESQGTFAERFASELEQRLPFPCPVELGRQERFEEPKVRVNSEPVDGIALGWNESAAWDQLADYYQTLYRKEAVYV